MTPGIYGYESLSNADYHASEGVSSSQLKTMLKAPAIEAYKAENPSDPSADMILGSAVHSKILTPSLCDVITEPDFNKRTKQGKEDYLAWVEANKNMLILTDTQAEQCDGMVDALMAHPMARILLSEGAAESSRYWYDPQTMELCKVRFDFFNEPHNVIVDLKTTGDASESAFVRTCVNFRYELSAMYYMEGARQTGQDPRDFVFIVIERKPPFLISLFTLPPELKNKGEITWRRGLNIWHQCRKTNTWPGYSEEIRVLDAPAWALRD